jgi:anaerobic selenocysteine-containing dehydrogenase
MPGKCQDEVDHASQMIRNSDGELVRASWDEAMDLIVKKSKDTIEKLSNHGMAFYTRRATQYALGTHWLTVFLSGQLFLEEYYTLGGSPSIRDVSLRLTTWYESHNRQGWAWILAHGWQHSSLHGHGRGVHARVFRV